MFQQQSNRTYSLLIGDTDTSTPGIPIPGTTEVGKGILITQLNMSFSITKHRDNSKRGSKGVIRVFNLSDDRIQFLEKSKALNVTLAVGYLGNQSNPLNQPIFDTILRGNITNVSTEKQGTNRVTSFEVAEAFLLYNNTRVVSTIPGGKTIEYVIEEIRKQMDATDISNGGLGVKKGIYAGVNKDITTLYGYPLTGTAKQKLDEIAKAYRIEWRIDTDKLYINDEGGVRERDNTRTFVYGQDTGLIDIPYFFIRTETIKLGTPEVTKTKDGKTRKKTTKKIGVQGVKFKALMNPYLRPGDLVNFKTFHKDKYYIINRITYSGEFRGQDWTIECECDEVTLLS